MLPIKKIVTGGQTGVDRAALDFAIQHNIPHGGWCPKGRLAEDGIISSEYNLRETPTATWDERTKRNIIDSDATLVLVNALPVAVTDGTQLTIKEAQRLSKPLLIVDIYHFAIIDNQQLFCFNEASPVFAYVCDWLETNKVEVLNIAGPRESQCEGIYQRALDFIVQFFADNSLLCFNLYSRL